MAELHCKVGRAAFATIRNRPCRRRRPPLLLLRSRDTCRRELGTSPSWSRAGPTASTHGLSSVTDLDGTKAGRQRVLILGSGWAGYNLARALDKSKFQPVIVSPRAYFAFTPLLASTAVGTLEFRTAIEPLRSRRNASHFIQGWADAVDLSRKTVLVEQAVTDAPHGGAHAPRHEGARKSEPELFAEGLRHARKGTLFPVSYDKLVLAVGSYSQTFGTPGVREHAFFLKDIGDARRIRKRLLECFEFAALPSTPDAVRAALLRFAVVGGGPTGIEFSAELHDLIHDDLRKLYPDLARFVRITVYDVAPTVLSMFDAKLAAYAMDTFRREGIAIRTSSTIDGLARGLPLHAGDTHDALPGYSLSLKGQPEPEGVGMVVWSTGLMPNPFIRRALAAQRPFPPDEDVIFKSNLAAARAASWSIATHAKSGSVLTNDRLRVILTTTTAGEDSTTGDTTTTATTGDAKPPRAFLRDVFAVGDCAVLDGTDYPATAQVANQKAEWLARRLNRGDLHTTRFYFRNLGTMAYLGSYRAIFQGGSGLGDVSGRTAWLIWRGAYLAKSVSWRNRVLIPIFWAVNWLFGRDISRF